MASLYYIPSQNIYLGKFGIYTEEEVSCADRLEKEWLSTQKNNTFYQLLEIFPSARGAVKRNLVAEIKQCKRDLHEARSFYNEYTYKIIPRARIADRWFFFVCRDFHVAELTEGRERIIKRNYFYLSALKPTTSIPTDGKTTLADVQRAKETPLDTLIEVNRAGFAQCPFHEDKTPSLKVYGKTNRWYCYSCTSGSDAIDLFMKLNSCDFIAAVKKLTNK